MKFADLNFVTGFIQADAGARRRRLCGRLAAALLSATVLAPVLPPVLAAEPAAAIDLSHWKLTLPDARATEIKPAQLMAGFANDWFQIEPAGSLLFTAVSDGGSTANSHFPRSELREMINPANKADNWACQGVHSMALREQVVQLPPSVGTVVFQIHGINLDGSNAAPLLKVMWRDGKLQLQIKQHAAGGKDTQVDVDGDFPLGSIYDAGVKVEQCRLSVSINGKTYTDEFLARDPAWNALRFYFKAGNYLQNTGTGSARSVAVVRIHQLSVHHG